MGTGTDKNACYLRLSSVPRTPVLYSYPPHPLEVALGGAFEVIQMVRVGDS